MNNKLLAVDSGWPCTFYEYQRVLKTIGYSFDKIAWAIVTHFHMDHAGLISEFINSGIMCFVFENQVDSIDEMERVILKNKRYKGYPLIDKNRLVYTNVSDFGRVLEKLGINGDVLVTNGHSPDSITYITDNKEAIIGDLYPPNLILDDDIKTIESWGKIRKKGIKKIYPGHAEVFDL
jgi:ribonuclease/clavin/mitogillin